MHIKLIFNKDNNITYIIGKLHKNKGINNIQTFDNHISI